MPRPPSGIVTKREIRITPWDQQPITQQELESHLHAFDKLILCEEGTPNGTPKLHYHGYFETTKSLTYIRPLLKQLAHTVLESDINGNSLYFSKQPHEHTMGYIVKNGKIICHHGVSESEIDEYKSQSLKYRREKETERKSKQRDYNSELMEIYEKVAENLKNQTIEPYSTQVIKAILDECYIKSIKFPARSQMEIQVVKLLYPYNQDIGVWYYQKSFQNNFSH